MMRANKISMTRLSIAAMAVGILTGAQAAHAGPNIMVPAVKVHVPQKVPVRPQVVRPHIVKPLIQPRISKKVLTRKGTAHSTPRAAVPRKAGAAHGKQPRKTTARARTVLPATAPLPALRPHLDKIKDMFSAAELGELDVGAFRVGGAAFDPLGALGATGLPDSDDTQTTRSGSAIGALSGWPHPGFTFGPDQLAGVGAGWINPAGSSSGKDASGLIAPGLKVTQETIASAKGGVAGGRNHGEWADTDGSVTGRPDSLYQVGTSTDENGNETASITTYENYETGVKTTTIIDQDGVTHEHTQPNGDRDVQRLGSDGQHESDYNIQMEDTVINTGGGATELRNPDHVAGSGYVPPNCGSYDCNKSRSWKTNPGLQIGQGKAGVAQVLTNGDHAAQLPHNGADPIVSQTDLTGRYNPEHDGSGPPQPLTPHDSKNSD